MGSEMCIRDSLVAIGGVEKSSGNATNRINVWDGKLQTWIHHYPPMPTVRSSAGCASYKHYVIVIGGIPFASSKFLSTVEVLDSTSMMWYSAPSTPCKGCNAVPVIIGHDLYVLLNDHGSSRTLMQVSLPTLISQATSEKSTRSQIWKRLPDTPLFATSLFSIGNMLLMAGGNTDPSSNSVSEPTKLKLNRASADIHLFNPNIKQWVKVSELPEPRINCVCIVLPCRRLVVAGGVVGEGGRTFTIGSVMPLSLIHI